MTKVLKILGLPQAILPSKEQAGKGAEQQAYQDLIAFLENPSMKVSLG